MNRTVVLLVLLAAVMALGLSPTMHGGVGNPFQALICDPPPKVLDGVPCSSLETWAAVAAILIGTLLVAGIALGSPRLEQWFRQRRGRQP